MEGLELHNASLCYGKRCLLKQVAFSLKPGEILGLYGRNGSGKSSLLHMIYGSLSKGHLEMRFEGNKMKRSEIIAKQIITMVPQQPHLPAQAKVRDLIPIYYRDQDTQDALFYDPIIAEFSAQKVNELSHGQRKYFEVVLASYLPVPLLFLDEPFSMLEPFQRERLQQFLKDRSGHKGILVTDHYYEDVWAIATKNMVLSDGILQTVKSKADLRQFQYLSSTTN